VAVLEFVNVTVVVPVTPSMVMTPVAGVPPPGELRRWGSDGGS
jgi:hypothetical protein